ncbi:MAG TPA: ABC transporter permease, partial [Tabrizicola sp.]|nr:ABC transporter permease [Tabrizicola sp.]
MLPLIARNRGFSGALALLAVLFVTYNILHPRGFSSAVFVQNANEAVAIAFVAMAQTVPVLMRGLDLSVGAVMTLTACVASYLLTGSALEISFGVLAVLATGTAFGLMNGLIVVYGRLQPIIATLATGAVAIGLALLLRPQPGGDVDGDLGWALTNTVWDFADTYGIADGGEAWWLRPFADVPVPLILLFGVALLV